MSNKHNISNLPDWEKVLHAAAHLQEIVPGAALVGGTASSLHTAHRRSMDADHVVVDLRHRFDAVLKDLEAISGWRTARVNRPVQILGSLDGIETGIRQLIREQPLDVETIDISGEPIIIPTKAEILRIKGILIVKRNATRDYLDFAALAHSMTKTELIDALLHFDSLYAKNSTNPPLQQLVSQISNPTPFDLSNVDLALYKGLKEEWQDWNVIKNICIEVSNEIILSGLTKADLDMLP